MNDLIKYDEAAIRRWIDGMEKRAKERTATGTLRLHELLRTQSIAACLDIFNDFSEAEAKTLSTSIEQAWKVGKEVSEL